MQQVLGGSSSIESLKNTEKVTNGTYYDKCKIARIRDITNDMIPQLQDSKNFITQVKTFDVKRGKVLVLSADQEFYII